VGFGRGTVGSVWGFEEDWYIVSLSIELSRKGE